VYKPIPEPPDLLVSPILKISSIDLKYFSGTPSPSSEILITNEESSGLLKFIRGASKNSFF